MTQTFGSALSRPWALVKWGGNQPNGRRPSTAVAYLTDPIKDADGNVTGYDGGLVEYYRIATKLHRNPLGGFGTIPGEPFAQWHFRYNKGRQFAVEDICTIFPNGKSRGQGPAQSQVRDAKKRVPVNANEEQAA